MGGLGLGFVLGWGKGVLSTREKNIKFGEVWVKLKRSLGQKWEFFSVELGVREMRLLRMKWLFENDSVRKLEKNITSRIQINNIYISQFK